MGLRVTTHEFAPEDYTQFGARLRTGLAALDKLLARPGFGEGPLTLGAELEMSLVGPGGLPRPVGQNVLADLSNGQFTEEIDQFNLEFNSTPVGFAGAPLSAVEAELRAALDRAHAAALTHGAEVVIVGILPTLEQSDLSRAVMTNTARYRALADGLRRQRHGKFRLRIDGVDPFETEADDVTLEGAATSLQLHLRVPPRDFARVHNAIQLATAPALAFSGNSPTFLGHRLWDETRIALFKQAVDARSEHDPPPRVARVCFGTDWVRDGALELFEQSVRQHAPLLPVVGNETDPESLVARGGIPELGELRLHHGTVWRWNRAVYDPSSEGHLRVELRAFPSGPTVTDMMATSAFVLGLALDLAPDAEEWIHLLSFDSVENNFYRAAQLGPDARLAFVSPAGDVVSHPARDLVTSLLDRAARGLRGAGVAEAEAEKYLSVFAARVERAVTGARWQRNKLAQLGYRLGRREAIGTMFREYRARVAEGAPVHTW